MRIRTRIKEKILTVILNHGRRGGTTRQRIDGDRILSYSGVLAGNEQFVVDTTLVESHNFRKRKKRKEKRKEIGKRAE